jgi:hypothetical protein
MYKTYCFMAFTLGAAVGSVVAWRRVRRKYERIAQEEIDSVKEAFSKRKTDNAKESHDVEVRTNMAAEKPGIAEYVGRSRERGYTNYSGAGSENKKDGKEERITLDKPYVISPDEFCESDEYEKISLAYYADQILADDNDDLIDDPEDVVGFESLSRFGEYEDDSVFVRNDRLKRDYEILLDQRKYSDVIAKKPREAD